MDYSKGYTASFYAAYVDPGTWQDGERFELVSGSINRNAEGLRQSAELTVREYSQTTDRWIRVFMDCDQEGDRAHVPLMTGIASTPGEEHGDAATEVSLKVYSPLKAAEDIKLELGAYIPAGTNGAEAVRRLLSAQPAPVRINGEAPALDEAVIAEQNEDCVTMSDRILEAIGWQLQIDGDGTIILSEKEANPRPKLKMSPDENDIIEPGFSKERDWFNCPNVLYVSSGSQTYRATDEDPESPLSIQARGREVIQIEDNVTLAGGEGIIQYGRRRLKELQQVTETAAYTRRFIPDINVGDAVLIDYPDLQGTYIIETQSISLTTNGQTQENAERTTA